MSSASAVFLTLALALAVLFGAQTNPWAWGPAMACLLLAMATALMALIKQPSRMLNGAMLALGSLTLIWLGLRALQSPVRELANADLLLLAASFGAFVSVLAIQQSKRAQWILTGGIAALLLANLVVMTFQVLKPGFSPLLFKSTDSITGFFTHYNYAANFLLVSSLWLLAQAWHARQRLLQLGLGLLGVLGMVAIYWTKSRGGLLAAIIALACLGVIILIEAKRNKAKWFPVAAIGAPLLTLVLLGLLITGWQKIQATKTHDGSNEISGMMDNQVRLAYVGAAASSSMSHPLSGGGSQSFSWESYEYLSNDEIGIYFTKPEYVHNEWLQAATDYGFIGFGLILSLMVVVGISAILRVSFEPKLDTNQRNIAAMRLAGIGGLIGMLAHANFSFIFHLMPGALMLGMCLAASCQWNQKRNQKGNQKDEPKPRMQHLQRGIFAVLALAFLILAAPLAIKGTRVMITLWPTEYSKDRELNAAGKLEALNRAIKIWPQAALHMKRAYLRHDLAMINEDEVSRTDLMEKALNDYSAAQQYHPFLPEAAINSANLLGLLGRHREADVAYPEAIELQGGMEATFKGHYLYATHLLGRGTDELAEKDAEAALDLFQRSAEQIDQAHPLNTEGRRLEIAIHEALGLAYELNAMPEKALEAYTHAASLHHGDGRRIHFRVALLQAAEANRLLKEREPSKALGLFLEAKQSINKAGGQLPPEISPLQRTDFALQLARSIKQLQEIGIKAP